MNALFVLFAFVSATYAAVPTNTQPMFYTFDHNDKQYFVSPTFEGNFMESIQFCARHGMELLSIETPAENLAVYNGLQKLIGSAVGHFWTSGSRLSTNGIDWVWMSNGEKIGIQYWGTGEPSTNGHNAGQNCLQLFMNYYQNGYWDDVECNTKMTPVCQRVVE